MRLAVAARALCTAGVRAMLLLGLGATPALAAPERAAANGPLSGERKVQHVLLGERWVMGYGGMMVLDYYPIVLYADGTFTKDQARAVSGDARIEGRWRREGNVPKLTQLDGKELTGRLSMSKAGRPANRGHKLSGVYGSFSGLGGGGTGTPSVVAWSHYTFAADGSVRTQRGSGASTANTPDSSRGSVVTRSTSAGETARYTLDGYTITFTSQDGGSRKALFYFMGSKDDMIVIGGRKLSRK